MTKTDILKMLNDADTYVSGQDICDKLELSRTAVWKAIKQLKEEGYEIDAFFGDVDLLIVLHVQYNGLR